MPPLSPKVKLRANNPSLNIDYILDPLSDPNELSAQFKLLKELPEMPLSPLNQRTIDKMMPIVGYNENGHFVAVARCDTPGCGGESRWSAEAVPKDPRVAFTKFRDRGWRASKKRLECPKCVKRRKAPPVKQFHREKPMNPIGEALRTAVERPNPPSGATSGISEPVPITAPPIERIAEGEHTVPNDTITASDKAKAAKRAAYALLLDHYDEAGKRYNGDWSDKKIAELVKMSEAFVAKIREDDFGPAGPPPQLIDLKERITRLENKLREKEVMVLKAMDEIPQMQEELKLCQSQLQAIIQAHGWGVE